VERRSEGVTFSVAGRDDRSVPHALRARKGSRQPGDWPMVGGIGRSVGLRAARLASGRRCSGLLIRESQPAPPGERVEGAV
jgi:hypothetical protein